MKRWFIGFLLTALLFSCPFNTYAVRDKFKGGQGEFHNGSRYKGREDARYIIRRTARVLFIARRAAERRQHYFGLARAVAHQRIARQLYWDGAYREAIFHSLRARRIAIKVIRQNNERPSREFYWDRIEEDYTRSAPRDSELDMKIDLTKIGRDDEMVHLEINLDID